MRSVPMRSGTPGTRAFSCASARSRAFILLIGLGALLLTPVTAASQGADSRAAEIAREQAEKAGRLEPYRPPWIERRLLEIEQAGGFGAPRGWFVTFGDIKSGSSIALGPAYGRTLDNGVTIVGKAAYSIRNFKLVQFAARSAPVADGRLVFDGRIRWQDAPLLPVYPLGTFSPRSRADYSERKTEVGARATLQAARFVRLGAGLAFEGFATGGADSGRASIDELFSPAEMPGLGVDPEYMHTFASAAFDSGAGAGYSRSGTLLGASFHDYRQLDEGPFSFRRVDAIARQLIPILHGNWVIDLSLRAATTDADGRDSVPFFLMPDLGGGSDLRAYSNYRFRDRHALLFTAEYRWYVQEFAEMAVFYDAGKVASRRSDLDFDNMRSDFGIGLRFHTPHTTVLRLEAARGTEGARFIISFSPPIR
jgi:hypothetical protein